MLQSIRVSRRALIACSTLLLCALAPAALAAPPVKLTAADARSGDNFGHSVSISGDTAIVGAFFAASAVGTNRGAAYMYRWNGAGWTQEAKLTAADAGAADFFGSSVSISGDTAVVGAYLNDDTAGVNQGAAYVYTRTGTTWTQQAKLTAADAAVEDFFGFSVSINGNTTIVGSLFNDGTAGANQGAAYVFTRTGTTWTQQAKLTPADATANDQFSVSVSINGDTALVGAFRDDGTAGTDQGSAYVFTRIGTTWTQQAKLTATDAAANDQFGISAAIEGNTAIVGAYLGDAAAGENQGAAFVYTRTGTTWTEQAKLTAADAAGSDWFGYSVSINADAAIVGALFAAGPEDTDQGAAYAFTRSGTTWTQTAKLTAIFGGAATNDQFGISSAIEGTIAIVGASTIEGTAGVEQGAAFVFTLCLQDLDGDNVIGGGDLGLLLGNWSGAGITDLNGDGTTDGADLGLLLGAWGAC